ncbi:hypothetical protein PISMIDRAFT_669959 [Pisolithus microcarpus 441]|uniref:Uncharacterized protein n=1 Tax=Pisolithus microcarpus 441 TaxID=765257 RepID=A0A0D0A9R0_9AGAM|nr:hypothetical protein PISMIDRAFT_669959 [Pisolithus microcarpus 441]
MDMVESPRVDTRHSIPHCKRRPYARAPDMSLAISTLVLSSACRGTVRRDSERSITRDLITRGLSLSMCQHWQRLSRTRLQPPMSSNR